MKKTLFITVAILLYGSYSHGQTNFEVVTPDFKDTFSSIVKQLESGENQINFKEFRESFIESEQFKIASNKTKELDSLEKEMNIQVKKSDYQEIIKTTKRMLSIDYTNMMAHKILRQTYKLIGDSINAQKYKTIQFGLLNSIVRNGDGKTCSTGWKVIQIEEEYFILKMLGADLKRQSIDETGMCDVMEVNIDGKDKTYYFEISKVFEGYKKLGIK